MLYPNPLHIPMDEFKKIEAPQEKGLQIMKTRMISSATHIHVLRNPSDVPFLEYFREIERIFRY